jgi:hypothetical protein
MKKPPEGGSFDARATYLLAAVAAALAASAAAEADEAADEAAASAAGVAAGAGAGTTTAGAGVGAAASCFLPQATSATVANRVANRSGFLIFILIKVSNGCRQLWSERRHQRTDAKTRKQTRAFHCLANDYMAARRFP